MTQHSDIIGGSTAAKRVHCPGSYRLEKQVGKGEASEYAERGTALHQAMEHFLLEMDGDKSQLNQLIGREFNQFIITDDMLATKIIPALAAFEEMPLVEYMVEVQVEVTPVPGAFGTVDILGVDDVDRLWVVDWKFGDGVPVSPVSNYQIGFYAAGALHDPNKEVRAMVDSARHDEIIFAIVQPRVGYEGEQVWQKWTTNREWLDSYVEILVEAHEKMTQYNAPLKMGDHCRWCRAQLLCPLQQTNARGLAESVRPKHMDSIEMATWLKRAEWAEEFYGTLKRHALAEMERGVKIPGFKVVPKRAQRTYADPEKAEAVLKKKLGATKAYKKELLSPAQAEKAVGKKFYRDKLEEYVTSVSSGTTIAPDTDPRPDVSDPSKSLANKLKATLESGNTTGGSFPVSSKQ